MSLEERPPLDPVPAPAPPSTPEARPYVCWGITAACIGVYLFEAWLSGDLNNPDTRGALNAAKVRSGQWWRMASCIFEHANLIHIGLNLSVVLLLGAKFERLLGHGLFLTASAFTAFGSSALALLLTSPERYTVGASGMIIGWAGALLPLATEKFRRWLLDWVVQVAILSFLPNISWQGHLGGLAAGLLFGYALRFTSPRA
jgi:rhomboid protease GluP